MYKIEKRFTLPIGHRLSKHLGRCSSIHGHNFSVLIGVKSEMLNDNDMVIDFSDLKKIVNEILDEWDHTLLVNNTDTSIIDLCQSDNMRCIPFSFDPTAEMLSKVLYDVIGQRFSCTSIRMDYVTLFENENSKATYME